MSPLFLIPIQGTSAYYWTSELNPSNNEQAQTLYIKTGGTKKMSNASRRTGIAIRPVEAVMSAPPPAEICELVDLGLSVKWCSQNLDANNPEGFGSYYAWGETSTKSTYTWANYKYAKCSAATTYGIGSDIQATGYDVAFQLGEAYDSDYDYVSQICLPTAAQFQELLTRCTWKKESSGFEVTGPSGKSIFFPFSGLSYDGSARNQGTSAYCIGLARQRAVEIKKQLLKRGIAEYKIEIDPKGSADPIGDNETYEGRIANNRVAIKIQ